MAVHFGIFELIVKLDRDVSAADVVAETTKEGGEGAKLSTIFAL